MGLALSFPLTLQTLVPLQTFPCAPKTWRGVSALIRLLSVTRLQLLIRGVGKKRPINCFVHTCYFRRSSCIFSVSQNFVQVGALLLNKRLRKQAFCLCRVSRKWKTQCLTRSCLARDVFGGTSQGVQEVPPTLGRERLRKEPFRFRETFGSPP